MVIRAGPKTRVRSLQSAPASTRGSPVSSHTSTTGDRPGLNLPAWKKLFGFGTSGGRKKKNEFPECAPSMISAIGPPVGGWIASRQPADNAAARTKASGTRFMERTPIVKDGDDEVQPRKARKMRTSPLRWRRRASPRTEGPGVSDLPQLSGANQGLEAGVVLERAPPPMHDLAKALTVLRVSHEVLVQQPQGLILVPQHRARERFVAEQLPLRVDIRVPLRAFQHVPRTIGEPGAGEHRRDMDVLEQALVGAVRLRG